MVVRDVVLAVAGVIGGGGAIMHGVILERHIIQPVEVVLRADKRTIDPVRRLVPLLLHFSTYNWLLGGLALTTAACWGGQGVKMTTGLLVGSSYLFGTLGNFWVMRARHFGWMLYAVALGLIAFGLS